MPALKRHRTPSPSLNAINQSPLKAIKVFNKLTSSDDGLDDSDSPDEVSKIVLRVGKTGDALENTTLDEATGGNALTGDVTASSSVTVDVAASGTGRDDAAASTTTTTNDASSNAMMAGVPDIDADIRDSVSESPDHVYAEVVG